MPHRERSPALTLAAAHDPLTCLGAGAFPAFARLCDHMRRAKDTQGHCERDARQDGRSLHVGGSGALPLLRVRCCIRFRQAPPSTRQDLRRSGVRERLCASTGCNGRPAIISCTRRKTDMRSTARSLFPPTRCAGRRGDVLTRAGRAVSVAPAPAGRACA
jgi:hypothetical protein